MNFCIALAEIHRAFSAAALGLTDKVDHKSNGDYHHKQSRQQRQPPRRRLRLRRLVCDGAVRYLSVKRLSGVIIQDSHGRNVTFRFCAVFLFDNSYVVSYLKRCHLFVVYCVYEVSEFHPSRFCRIVQEKIYHKYNCKQQCIKAEPFYVFFQSFLASGFFIMSGIYI